MPVRSFWKLFVLGAATACAGSADASSIVALAPMTGPIGPSMIVAGPPDMPEDAVETNERRMVTRSILAFGPPDVAYENVASVGEKPKKPRRGFAPMVLRGGIAGAAFSSASMPAQPVQASVPADALPAPSRQSAAHKKEPADAPAPESPVTY
ncbi:hypothetical protein [Allomesorhizobium camelthorni]|uniref:Uncharacterized protein n=1 Tax=Allomesorhizobium camelthorni TaxID=475069 RepID=A0A6G4W813_9HYPH|nr:hypothetical protein [Mesorhizobium camelthorni]NGO50905.1 hypothetical protein [Mesorhizobium camelthorni]